MQTRATLLASGLWSAAMVGLPGSPLPDSPPRPAGPVPAPAASVVVVVNESPASASSGADDSARRKPPTRTPRSGAGRTRPSNGNPPIPASGRRAARGTRRGPNQQPAALGPSFAPFTSTWCSYNRIHPVFAEEFIGSLDGLPPRPLNDATLMARIEIRRQRRRRRRSCRWAWLRRAACRASTSRPSMPSSRPRRSVSLPPSFSRATATSTSTGSSVASGKGLHDPLRGLQDRARSSN